MIVQKLSTHFGVDPDGNLSNDEKNVSHALISMIENHLCWVYVYWRSKNPDAMIKVMNNSHQMNVLMLEYFFLIIQCFFSYVGLQT